MNYLFQIGANFMCLLIIFNKFKKHFIVKNSPINILLYNLFKYTAVSENKVFKFY